MSELIQAKREEKRLQMNRRRVAWLCKVCARQQTPRPHTVADEEHLPPGAQQKRKNKKLIADAENNLQYDNNAHKRNANVGGIMTFKSPAGDVSKIKSSIYHPTTFTACDWQELCTFNG